MCVCVCVCVCVYIYTFFRYVCVYIYVYTCVCVCVCMCVNICQIIYEHTGMHIQKQYLRSVLKVYDYVVLQYTLLMLWTLYSTLRVAEKIHNVSSFGLWTFCQRQWTTPKR